MFKFFSTWNNKKRVSLCLGFFLLTLFLFWPSSTFAFVQTLINVVVGIPAFIVNFLLIISIYATYIFAFITGTILDIAMSPGFVSLSYTNPAANPIIRSGLSVTQSFVNLLLVVALVYTALSMALRINETETKQILARLIIVALLVNFAPVVLGLVVDAANITMNYFLRPIQAGASGILLQMDIGRVASMVLAAGIKASEQLGVLAAVITQIALNIGAGMAFFLFAGTFLFRYIAIWILVILAPLAFVFWIIPQTRSLWNMWLNNFVQWSIIGIPIAFFLYLAVSSFSLITVAFQQRLTMPLGAEFAGFFNQVFPFFVVIIFLFLGFIVGMQTSAMGGSAVINFTKKAGTWAAAKTGKGMRRAGSWGLQKLTKGEGKDRVKRWAAAGYMPKGIAEMKGLKGVAAKVGYGILTSPVAPLWYALRRGVGEAGLKLTEAETKDVRKAEEEHKDTSAERDFADLRDPLRSIDDKVGILRQAIEKEKIDDIKKLGLKDPEIVKIGQQALRINPEEFKKIRDAFPNLAEEMGVGFTKNIQEKVKINLAETLAMKDGKGNPLYSGVMERIIAEMKTTNVPKMNSSILFGSTAMPAAMQSAQKNWQAGHWAEAGKSFGRKFCDEVRADFLLTPNKFTESAQKYFTTSPAGRSLYGI